MKTAIVIVVVLVLLAIAVAAYLMSKRRTEHRREQAGHLRREVEARSSEVDLERRRAAEAEARAEAARLEAERAEELAAEARQGMQFEEARQEDGLRRADALDPDVDHRSSDYRPGSTGSREA